MKTSHINDDIAPAIRQYGATVRASLRTDEAGPVSYAGLWLLLASLAPVVTEAEEFRNILGLTVKEAGDHVAGLLGHPHPAVAAALGAWLAQDITLAGDLPVTLEKLPSQDALDKWANDKTGGLLDTFPVQLEPETMLVLASALVLSPRWSGGVSYDGDEDDTLLLTSGLQAVVGTSIGPVAVTKPATDDGVDVISVIAAPDVPPAQVWDAVEEVVARRRPARPQLHHPAGPPRHLDPQPPTRRRKRRVRLRPARHTHPHRAPSLRTPGRADPTDPEVARTPNPENRETPAQQGFHASHGT